MISAITVLAGLTVALSSRVVHCGMALLFADALAVCEGLDVDPGTEAGTTVGAWAAADQEDLDRGVGVDVFDRCSECIQEWARERIQAIGAVEGQDSHIARHLVADLLIHVALPPLALP